MDMGAKDSQSLTFGSDNCGVQDSSNDLQATSGGGLGYAMGSGDDVGSVKDCAGADVVLRAQEDPLDHADLRELCRQSIHSTDNPAGGTSVGGANGHSQEGEQSEFHGAQLRKN